MNSALLEIINQVRQNKKLPALAVLHPADRLREELGFDSLDLAELTVRLEERFGIDVFADGLVSTAGEIAGKLNQN